MPVKLNQRREASLGATLLRRCTWTSHARTAADWRAQYITGRAPTEQPAVSILSSGGP